MFLCPNSRSFSGRTYSKKYTSSGVGYVSVFWLDLCTLKSLPFFTYSSFALPVYDWSYAKTKKKHELWPRRRDSSSSRHGCFKLFRKIVHMIWCGITPGSLVRVVSGLTIVVDFQSRECVPAAFPPSRLRSDKLDEYACMYICITRANSLLRKIWNILSKRLNCSGGSMYSSWLYSLYSCYMLLTGFVSYAAGGFFCFLDASQLLGFSGRPNSLIFATAWQAEWCLPVLLLSHELIAIVHTARSHNMASHT